MALPAYIVDFLFAENAYKRIKGDVGLLGRQTTYLKPETLSYLSERYGFKAPRTLPVELDRSPAVLRDFGEVFITDHHLLKFLGARSVKTIDGAGNDSADIVVDIGAEKLPRKLTGAFDFIYGGNSLDTVFNPAEALRNISRLLRPGGRVLLLSHASWLNGPYNMMSPGWYFDFFVANAYADCQVFLGLFATEGALHFGPMNLLYFNWTLSKIGNVPPMPPGFQVMLMVLAEKGKKSTDDIMPVQHIYRDQKYGETVFQANAERILRSPRRLFSMPKDIAAQPDPFIKLALLGARSS